MNYIYRIVHIENIPLLMKDGIVAPPMRKAEVPYVPIGNTDLVAKRNDDEVTTIHGTTFKVGEFVPFYFFARMPMLYNIQHGYGVSRVNAENIVHVVVPILSVIRSGVPYFFSDGHALNRNLVKFYEAQDLTKIDELLDRESILSNDWGNDYLIGIRKQAEFFVGGVVAPSDIYRLICYNESAKQRLLKMGVTLPIQISKEAYY